MKPWFEREEFWDRFRPVLFPEGRWEATAEQCDALLRLAGFPEGGRILDLCCGPGRHALELTRRGYSVTGVDRTAAYLEEGREKAGAENLAIEFVKEDMRRFRRPDAFDGAINLFTSFGYFEDPEDDRRVLENLRGALRPGGILVMEMVGREILARHFQERDWHHLDEPAGAILLEERKLTRGWGWIECTWTLITEDERTSITFSHRPYAGTELAALLRACGFASVELFGGLDGSAYDQNAKRLVAVARTSA